MLLTIYKYELKKLFFAKVNLIVLAGSVIMLVVLAISSVAEVSPVSRAAAGELDGRKILSELSGGAGGLHCDHSGGAADRAEML